MHCSILHTHTHIYSLFSNTPISFSKSEEDKNGANGCKRVKQTLDITHVVIIIIISCWQHGYP